MNKWKSMGIYNKMKLAKRTMRLRYKLLGYGHSRMVYDMGNGYVLKVATSEWGISGNKTEFELFTKSPPEIRNHLCPVIQHGHGWIIMEKMPVNVPDHSRYQNSINQMRTTFTSHGLTPKDIRRANLALSKDGVIKVIDYGNFIQNK
ncbi:hypothetical protein J7I91_20830 [Pseudomonas sp. ISL-84]|nr:hypothetical protein [Pseudomonas sp. ISL-84]